VRVENRPGANGAIAADTVARASPDQISLSFGNNPTLINQVRFARLRAIAVTGARRTDAAAGVLTVAESGVAGYEVSNWFGVSAPAKTPPAIVERLYSEIARPLKSHECARR
jgi:tripartite-type tricarboxylate transporter receptor subunit TctC